MHKVRLDTRYFLLDSNIWCVCEHPKNDIETLRCKACGYRTKLKTIKKGFYDPDKLECQVLGNDFKTTYKPKL